MGDPRMFYIMGRAHCGSTFLDVVLGNVDGVESVGEVTSGLKRGHAQMCSCGLRVGECPFWTDVAKNYREYSQGRDLFVDGAWLWKESDARKLPHALFTGLLRGGQRWEGYSKRQINLVAAIAETAHATAVLDSNKEYSRAIMLLKMRRDTKVIHLHRSPITTLASRHHRVKEAGTGFRFMKRTYYYRTESATESGGGINSNFAPEWTYPVVLVLTAAAWSVGMALGLLIGAIYPRQVLNVSYESLMADPSRELTRIGQFLEVDTSNAQTSIADGQAFDIGHIVGGNNQVRHSRTVTFDPKARGRRYLPTYIKCLAMPFALPGSILRALFAH